MQRNEVVYELVMGFNDLNQNRPPESRVVKNEFHPDSQCRALLDRVYLARVRLGMRLKTDANDEDIMMLVDSYEELQRLLCLCMYDYGALLERG